MAILLMGAFLSTRQGGMLEAQTQHQTIKVRQLIEDHRAGRIVIPELQREYVWKTNRAPRLIDSLYRGFPIASLLLWQSADEVRSRARSASQGRGSVVDWLIDGQQRTITLSRVFGGDEGIDVVFNPDDEEFRLLSAATKKSSSWFRVADIWDDELYRHIRRGLDGGPTADLREKRFEKVRRILDHEIPVSRMVDHPFEDAVEAFTRINTLGVKLKGEDIESAKVAAKHSGFIADHVAPFLDTLRRGGFSRMNVMHLFLACAFVARPDGRSRTPLHTLSKEEALDAWKRTERATEEAMALIHQEIGLTNMDILWSGALVVPLIVLCASQPAKERDARGLAGWLSLAALGHRYSGSAKTAIEQDLRACRTADPLGALLTNLRQQRPRLTAEPGDFDGFLADRSGLLSLYLACRHRAVEEPSSAAVPTGTSPVRQHLFPRSLLGDANKPLADSLPNIVLLGDEAHAHPWSKGPATSLKGWTPRMLEDQCIPDAPSLWTPERATDFWAARKELLAQSFNDLIREALPRRQL